jgi:hypothetical protein
MTNSVRNNCSQRRNVSLTPPPQIVNVLISLGEFPEIRYYNPPSLLGPASAVGEHATQRLANRVHQAMEAYCRENAGFPVRADLSMLSK